MIQILLKYKEIVLYLIFGVLTTVVNIMVYFIFASIFKINYLVANIIAWFVSVLFAYLTNRRYVFESKKSNIIHEIISFFCSRIATGLIDILLMWILVDNKILDDFIAKVVANILVIVLNYLFSKLIVFKEEK